MCVCWRVVSTHYIGVMCVYEYMSVWSGSGGVSVVWVGEGEGRGKYAVLVALENRNTGTFVC